jgi:hypothetical protein
MGTGGISASSELNAALAVSGALGLPYSLRYTATLSQGISERLPIKCMLV